MTRAAKLGVEGAALAVILHEQLADGTTVEILHDQVVDPVDHAELLDVDHVLMADPGADPCFVDERLNEVRLLDQVRMDHLERDEPREPGGAMAPGEVELCHATDPQPLDDLVVAEPLRCLSPPSEQSYGFIMINRPPTPADPGQAVPLSATLVTGARCACPARSSTTTFVAAPWNPLSTPGSDFLDRVSSHEAAWFISRGAGAEK